MDGVAICLQTKGEMIMGVPKDYTGKKYGMLTPIRRLEKSKNGYYIWLCKCDCGNEVERTVDVFTRGLSSCGCKQNKNIINMNKKNTTHNMSKTRLYGIYKNMLSRCYREKDIHYSAYGARGITICEEWLNDRSKFFEWALSNGYSDNLTIERIDNDKGYYPDNCAWVTKEMQYKNKRQNIMITYEGKTLCAEDWSKVTGIPSMTIRWRYKHGWSAERTLTTKPYTKGE